MDAKGGTAPTTTSPNPRRSGAGSALAAAAVLLEAPDQSGGSKAMLQAFHFLRALSRIHGVAGGPVRRRTRTIRRAAYSSMARAASSPRRVWSQALLRQARARRSTTTTTRRTVQLVRRRVVAGAAPPLPAGRANRSTSGSTAAGETSAAAAARALIIPPPRQAGEPSRTDALRRLVPGGAGMEYCSLLEETADYVRCLRAQVQLMQGLADLFSCQ